MCQRSSLLEHFELVNRVESQAQENQELKEQVNSMQRKISKLQTQLKATVARFVTPGLTSGFATNAAAGTILMVYLSLITITCIIHVIEL